MVCLDSFNDVLKAIATALYIIFTKHWRLPSKKNGHLTDRINSSTFSAISSKVASFDLNELPMERTVWILVWSPSII